MPGRFSLRPATADDAPALAATLEEAFEAYRAFAPPGWDPPAGASELATLRERLAGSETWCLVAERDGEVVAHVAVRPASMSRPPSDDPALGHLWQLFVRPAHHGTGLATRLLREAESAARERGFERMRLYTPAGQARARRFYEREGWTVGEEFDDPEGFGLRLVRYDRDLRAA